MRWPLRTPKGDYGLDFLIFATGFGFDLSRRPELAELRAAYPAVARPVSRRRRTWRARSWRRRPTWRTTTASRRSTQGECPALARIHCFNHHATLSHGKLSGDIPAVSEGAERLARGIARSLFVEDAALHYAALQAFDVAELQGDEWTDADAKAHSIEETA